MWLNYYTHYDQNKRNKTIDVDKLPEVNWALLVLLEYHLMTRVLGFDQDFACVRTKDRYKGKILSKDHFDMLTYQEMNTLFNEGCCKHMGTIRGALRCFPFAGRVIRLSKDQGEGPAVSLSLTLGAAAPAIDVASVILWKLRRRYVIAHETDMFMKNIIENRFTIDRSARPLREMVDGAGSWIEWRSSKLQVLKSYVVDFLSDHKNKTDFVNASTLPDSSKCYERILNSISQEFDEEIRWAEDDEYDFVRMQRSHLESERKRLRISPSANAGVILRNGSGYITDVDTILDEGSGSDA